MEKHEGREGSDLFQEIQEKVDREMFREPEGPDAVLTSASISTPEETSVTSPEVAEFEVVVDVIDPDAVETEVDDAFLEEVDYLPPESDVEAVLSVEVPPVGETTADPPLQEIPPVESEAAFVQEDDLFLGELIGKEMVGAADEAEGPEVAASSFEERTDAGEGDEDVLNTRTLGDLYADQGHYDSAVEIYERLVRNHPEDEDLRAELEGLREKQRAASAEISAVATGAKERE